MKKTLIIAAALAVTSVASFAQGTFFFTGNTKTVWDNYTTAVGHLNAANEDVAFLIGTGTPKIAQVAASVATNAASAGVTWSAATAWSDILGDSNFFLATNSASSSTAAIAAVATTSGAWSYNSAGSFTVNGTTAGATYTVYAIAWNAAYATPALASAANSAVGWSAAFTYVAGNPGAQPPTTPQAFNASVTAFGVSAGAVPEPGTIALAGMGIASLLAFRRRNSK